MKNGKEEVLRALMCHGDDYLSGQELADLLKISRHAVWKYIDKLRQEGYDIEARTRHGYRLSAVGDVLGREEIVCQLQSPADFQVEYHASIDSTNNHARALAEAGASAWTVVVADEQSQGRGRMGRNFHSPAASGLYMSVIIRPECAVEHASLLTIAAATAVAESIETVCGVKAQLKWVNDCFVNGKKVAGILTEGAVGLEEQRLRYAVVGIGINVAPPEADFPEELRDIAASVLTKAPTTPVRSILAAHILERLKIYADDLLARDYLPIYREKLMMLDQDVTLIQGNQEREVHVCDINESGGLIIRDQFGTIETITSGEISLRMH